MLATGELLQMLLVCSQKWKYGLQALAPASKFQYAFGCLV